MFVIDLAGIFQVLWPTHCVKGTFGAGFRPDLKIGQWDRVFSKEVDREVDSYSAFFENARHRSTGLAEYLDELGVKDLHIAGLATDYCVKFSVFHREHISRTSERIIKKCSAQCFSEIRPILRR